MQFSCHQRSTPLRGFLCLDKAKVDPFTRGVFLWKGGFTMNKNELDPLSAVALFGEEGPLRIDVPGWSAKIDFQKNQDNVYSAECSIQTQVRQQEFLIKGATPTEAVLGLGEEISVEVINFANQLPIDS